MCRRRRGKFHYLWTYVAQPGMSNGSPGLQKTQLGRLPLTTNFTSRTTALASRSVQKFGVHLCSPGLWEPLRPPQRIVFDTFAGTT